MTKLTTPPKPRWRETAATFFDRGRRIPIAVATQPGYLMIRLKNSQRLHSVSYDAILALAIKSESIGKGAA